MNKACNRTDDFRTDPLISTGSAELEDYRHSGYDRGHLAPAADMHFSRKTMSESFYMSNMSPQEPRFNRGIWRKLEKLVRNFAVNNRAVYVVTGPVLNKGIVKSIGKNQVGIPGKYYKVILDYERPEYKAIAFLLPNKGSSKKLVSFATSVDEIEKETNLDFFSELPDSLENGARRLQHVEYLRSDPVLLRFSHLTRLPGERTLSRWLKKFKASSLERLYALNSEIVARVVGLLGLGAITIDVDGTVVSTGMKVQRAFRGYNPHRRKVPSYYPITAALAETGHMLRVKNRSGNVHDGKASVTFLRALFGQIEETLGGVRRARMRMDGAFFRDEVLRILRSRGFGYAIKVPFWRCLDLRDVIRRSRRWSRVGRGIDYLEHRLDMWGVEHRVVIYRKKVSHISRKNYQLDLFDPDDGHWEYSAITTDLPLGGKRLWHFMCGRGVHEKIIGRMKSDLAFGSVPTNHYGANSAWQQIATLAHNLLINFQIETGASRRNRSWKNTLVYRLKSVQTLRFELLCRAGRVVNPNGRTVLKLSRNDIARKSYLLLAQRLKNIA